jgi:hypothetical protein
MSYTTVVYKWPLIFVALLVAGSVAYIFVAPVKAPTKNGRVTVLTTERGNADTLRNISIKPGDFIFSPLTVKGEARGTWFFEASFPIVITDWDGKIIAQVPAQAQGEWMTNEYVPFVATLTFTKPTPGDPSTNRGTIILQKDNPSGLPEHDDSLEIPIVFK